MTTKNINKGDNSRPYKKWVEKFFAGGELLGNREHLLEVLDVNILKKNKDNPRKAWRSINLTTLTSLKIGGKEWI